MKGTNFLLQKSNFYGESKFKGSHDPWHLTSVAYAYDAGPVLRKYSILVDYYHTVYFSALKGLLEKLGHNRIIIMTECILY